MGGMEEGGNRPIGGNIPSRRETLCFSGSGYSRLAAKSSGGQSVIEPVQYSSHEPK